MIRRTLLSAGACLLLSAAASAASAQTSVCAEFDVDGTGLKFTYDPFSRSVVVQDVALRVTRRDPQVTQVRFILADPTPRGGDPRIGTFGPDAYDLVWLQDQGRRVFVWGAERVTQTNSARANFSDRVDQQVAQFRFTVPAGQPVRADDQIERLEIRYECWAGAERLGGERAQLDNRVMIDMDVTRLFGAYIGNEGRSRGAVDFGPLDPDGGAVARSLAVSTVSTVPYNVSIATQNGGVLKQGADGAGIPFSMRFADNAVTDGALLRCSETRVPSGDVHQLELTVDQRQARAVPAGSYRDTVTLTFSPRDGATGTPSACRLAGG